MKRWAAVGLIVLMAAGAYAAWERWPRRLVVALGGPASVTAVWAGPHAVTLTLIPAVTGDNGPVQIAVAVDGAPVGAIDSTFSQDTLQDQPAGHWWRAWVDGDLWPDVVIEASAADPRQYVVGSGDGRLYALPAP